MLSWHLFKAQISLWDKLEGVIQVQKNGIIIVAMKHKYKE